VTERQDSKQAEKTYLSRTGGSAWEREKPFPPADAETPPDTMHANPAVANAPAAVAR
jgi:hypothetical protein